MRKQSDKPRMWGILKPTDLDSSKMGTKGHEDSSRLKDTEETSQPSAVFVPMNGVIGTIGEIKTF